MNVVITGHTGFLGSELYTAFARRFNTKGFSTSSGLNLTNANTLQVLPDKCDLVIHCAAMLNVSADNFVSSADVNIMGALHIASYAQKTGARLIHISSIFALEHAENGYYDGYGAEKKAAEDMLQQYARLNDLKLLILRLPQLYDHGVKAKKSQPMIYRLIDQIVDQQKATLYGSQAPQRNYLFIKDALDLILEVSMLSLCGTFNCPHPFSVTISEMIKSIGEARGKEAEICFLPHKENLKTIHVPNKNLIWDHVSSVPKNHILNDMNTIIKGYREE